jgi:sulfate adenylyltransferase (ADP) / ATP adenylyltransferase
MSHLQTEAQLKELANNYHLGYKRCLEVLNNADGKLPYNFMVTKDWMMMVLRSAPNYQGVPVNSLGYLGLLFGKNEE